MNHCFIADQFELSKNQPCEYVKNVTKKFDNFNEFKDCVKNTESTYKAKVLNQGNLPEEVIVKKNKIVLICDYTRVNYSDVEFIIEIKCSNQGIIKIKDQGIYCEKCYNKFQNYPKIETVQKILKELEQNPLKGIPVSRKIQCILSNAQKQLTSTQIYEQGIPWEIKGKTPRNTIAARCSTLYQQGFIKKDGCYYYV